MSDEFYYYEFEYRNGDTEDEDEDEENWDDIVPYYLQDYKCRVEAVHGYGEEEDMVFTLSGLRSRFFGTELEIEFDCCYGKKNRTMEYVAMEIQSVLDIAIPCFDSSIAAGSSERTGFEVKTRPDSIKNTLEQLKKVCDFALGHDRSFYGHDTAGRCGFHIHISRASLTPSQEVKLYLFMHDPANKSLIKAVMRRYDVSCASIIDIRSGVISSLISSAKKGFALNKYRSECLNFTPKTLEFRGGRSTLKLESLQVTLEFVNALLAFTAPATTGIKNRNSEGFKEWLKTQHGFKALKTKLLVSSKDLK